ncbi:hypothetical protein [Azohydromonas australica]|uniref:hypothetical protein n=1 Tax=Azohydromonas australica TaxID=364039 RepID=UPI000424C00C|nr:hypothetical protein [Azohydromonas australica]
MLNGFSTRAMTALALLATLSWTGPARALDSVAGPAQPLMPSAAAPAPQRAGLLLLAKPVTADVLAAHRGGAQTLNEVKLDGVVADNHAVNLATGSNTISDGAFANAAGLPLVVQNSGNNVLIQNATIVNLQLK